MLLLIGVLLLITLTGIWGMWRGVLRSLLTIVGTLLGAVLVELWGPTWGEQLQGWLNADDPAGLAWGATALGFLVVALILGYGSSLLLPRSGKLHAISAGERLTGALVGALNGLLMSSFLLHYGVEMGSPEFRVAVQALPILTTLQEWLPWYVLAVVLTMSFWVMVLAVVRLITAVARPTPEVEDRREDRHTESARPAASGAYSAPSGQKRHLKGVSSKIDQVLGNDRR
jgi:uncharacterized membrane protein required for colicin V production